MNAVFHFVVRRLRWLIRIPFLPQLFDTLLVAWTSVARPRRLKAMMAMESALRDRVDLAVHGYGGVEFRDGRGRQLGHIHGHGLLDVCLSRSQAQRLIDEGRVLPHHIYPDSGWVSFQLESPEDVPSALALIEMAGRRTSPGSASESRSLRKSEAQAPRAGGSIPAPGGPFASYHSAAGCG